MAGTGMLDAQGNGPEFVLWPDWKIGDIPSLAKYVSTPALDETGLPARDPYTSRPGTKAGTSRAASTTASWTLA